MMTLERENMSVIQKTGNAAIPKRQYHQIDLEYQRASNALWTYMKPLGVPCFNLGMVEELHQTFAEVQSNKGQFFMTTPGLQSTILLLHHVILAPLTLAVTLPCLSG